MKKFYKAVAAVTLLAPAYSSLACNDLEEYQIEAKAEEANIVTFCDNELNVLFGYDAKRKAPAWAVYEVSPGDKLLRVTNNGHYPKSTNIESTMQRDSKELLKAGFDHGTLIPPYQIVKQPADIVNAYRMNNIFPVIKEIWRKEFEPILFNLAKQEIGYANSKGKVVVSTVLSYAKDNDQVQMPVAMLKSYYQPDTHLSLTKKINLRVPGIEEFTTIDCIETELNMNLYSKLPNQDDLENRKARSNSIWSRLDGNEEGLGQCVI